MDYPQVVLFGSIYGDWRENVIIPVLEELGVTYYNPVSETGWNKNLGDREADVMAHCETIIMVFNRTSPSFTSLAEAGWAALGAHVRGQTFIMQIDHDYTYQLPPALRDNADADEVRAWMQHWVTSSRYLTVKHAKEFNLPTLHIADTLDDIAAILRVKYRKE
jgi:hypothetical protein